MPSLRRLVQRRADVLPRLARELQVRQVDRGCPRRPARRCQPSAAAASAVSSVAENRHGTQPAALAHARRTSRTASRPIRGGPTGSPRPTRRRRAAGRRAKTPPVGGRTRWFSGQVAIHDSVPPPLLLQHLHRGRLVDRGGRGASPQPTARRHAEGAATDDEDHEDRRPQQLVGGEARQPGVDVEVAAEDRDEDAEHRDDEAEEHVEARDDDGEPPGQPLAAAEPRDQEQRRRPA